MIGVAAARKQKRDREQSGAENLLVAGRNLPLLVGVFTMTATWVGGGYINGTAEAVYDPGQGLIWCQAPWGYALSLVIGGLFFAGRMRRAGYTTMLDPFEERYGTRVTAGLFLACLMGEIFWSAAILAALGMTFSVILDLDVSTSIVISAIVVLGYTVIGGLWSVAYTDVIQLLLILFGLALAIPFALAHVGDSETLISRYAARMEAGDLLPGHTVWSWSDSALMLICGGIPWQVYFQRVLACRTEKGAVGLSLAAGVGCLLMAVPAVALGAIGATADWQSLGIDGPDSPALVLPHVLKTLTPPLVATIALGAVSAAVMSSMDSSVLSGSSLFVWNVYRPLLRPNAVDRELIVALRIAVLVIGAATTWLALTVQSVYGLWFLCADVVYVVVFPQLVLVLFSRRANYKGAVCGMLVGLLLRLGAGEGTLGIPTWIEYPLAENFPFRTAAMLANLTTTWIVSLATAGRDIQQEGQS